MHEFIDAHSTARIGDGVSVSESVDLKEKLTVGEGAVVDDNSVLHASVPPFVRVSGNPAEITEFLNPTYHLLNGDAAEFESASVSDVTDVGFGCFLLRLGEYSDLRGSLIYGCSSDSLPFLPTRFFITTASKGAVRGEHAHRTLKEFLVPVSGGLKIAFTDGIEVSRVCLNDPAVGLLLAPYVWSCQYDFEDFTSLLVLASDPYDPSSYIRDFKTFRKECESLT